jgi:signal transduction histidine kinase
MCRELLVSADQQERLIESLLTLASGERGLDRQDSFDAATVVGRAIAMHRGTAERRRVRLCVSLGDALVVGDADLAERMAANLIDNAIRYNVPAGASTCASGSATGARSSP